MDEGFKGRIGGNDGCKIDEKWNYKKMRCEKKSKEETKLSIFISFIVVIIMSMLLIFYKDWYFLIFLLLLIVIVGIFNYSSIKNSFS